MKIVVGTIIILHFTVRANLMIGIVPSKLFVAGASLIKGLKICYARVKSRSAGYNKQMYVTMTILVKWVLVSAGSSEMPTIS